MTMLDTVDVVSVQVLHGTVVHLAFEDGTQRVLDLRPLMRGPVFDQVFEQGMFDQVAVDPDLGTVVWPNGADLSPDVLRYDGHEQSWLRQARKNSWFAVVFSEKTTGLVQLRELLTRSVTQPRVPEGRELAATSSERGQMSRLIGTKVYGRQVPPRGLPIKKRVGIVSRVSSGTVVRVKHGGGFVRVVAQGTCIRVEPGAKRPALDLK